MAVVVMLHIKAKPEQYEAIKAWHREHLPETRAAAGCLAVHACCNPEDHSMDIYERWETKADQEAYVAWRVARGDSAVVAPMTRAPTVFVEREEVFSA